MLSVSEIIKTMKTGEAVCYMELHCKPPAKAELYSRFFRSTGTNTKIYSTHCLCGLFLFV